MATKKSAKGEKEAKSNIYVCGKCGLKVKVDDSACFYTEKEIHNILCCGQAMRPEKSIINQSGDA